MQKFCLILALLCCATLSVSAQVHSNIHRKNISTKGTVSLDSLSIVPNSVAVSGADSSFYFIDFVRAQLTWLKPLPKDSVAITYRVFPFRLNATASRYTFDSITDRNGVIAPIFNNNEAENNSLFNFGKIDYNGSFGRSMSFGNNQDAVFNSDFNLQMNGYIGDSIHLLASLTDNNIPIQPEGTTQQLNDFDNILLQFSKRNWEINLGDIDLRTNDNYFLSFYKRLEGISYTQKLNIGENITNKTTVSGAIAKGKFARNVLNVSEGNQGPYRLQGNNNELYFIVLAGTEKVYLDGQLLQRGASQDYTIDYNAAQITFMPKHLITRDSRVQVEFEYADQNYLNSMLYVNNETQFGKKFKLTVSAYNNADAKNSPINQTLDADKINFLKQIGDSVQDAFYPVASIDTFSANAIMYKKIDTIVNNKHDSVYVYSTNPDSAKYNLSFIEVGANKGNYEPLLNGANGKVYQWIAPLNGVPQGDYEPAEFLVAPKKQQVVSVKTEYNIDDKTLLKTELATSETRVNTFSPKNSDDIGYAGKFELLRTDKLKTKKDNPYSLTTDGSFEFETPHFQTVETLRPVEFYRDWGLDIVPTQSSEKLGSLKFILQNAQQNFLSYQFSTYLRGDGYKGFKNIIDGKLSSQNGWNINEQASLTSISMPDNKGYYFTPTIDVSKTFKHLNNYSIGANYSLEHNEIRNNLADSILPTSYAFETVSAYIKSDQSKRNNWAFTYSQRKDEAPYGKNLVETDHSRNFNLQASFMQNQAQQLRITATYRELFVDDSSLISGQQPDKSFLGRLEYFVNAKKGFITGNLLYDVGAGQEQKMDYTFYQVPAGQGQYTWNDYNNDGIQQLNEFEIAAFPDEATFIKIYTPTNVFVKANYTTLNYSLNLNPKVLFGNGQLNKVQSLLSKLSLQSSLQSNKKVVANGGPEFNPFNNHVADSALLNLNYIFSNTLSLNRFNSKWGLDITRLINYNKSLLTYGAESAETDVWSFKGRMNISKAYTLEILQKIGTNDLKSPSFANRNFALKTLSSQPTITYTNGTKWRLSTSYIYALQKNAALYGGEKETSNSLNFDTKYNAVQNTSITMQFSYNNISYNGDPNSTVSYTILQGLLPGKNYQWTINFTKRLLNNIEINFQYQGRKPGNTKVINIGTASVRAIL
ncbi:hypothetical protein A9P82_00480 [Arachidicoccus ginsenosidimutans]|uniref:hypothetical protein n=1 Tax=Arachidicoccus sp. BS20 TaxID=1850526 RepID=UPI0007F0B41A|nr:hypothetical protein [Arachidicoccus sp. BS20]ANI87925.1 hypothetical protein A9P82_00480 [Arachidicoccus sp. BS20]